MNLNQFTQKSLEAVQSARDLAVQNGHQQLEQVHLLLALLKQAPLNDPYREEFFSLVKIAQRNAALAQ
jgi:ATP-dependent Clp protease ATP-binding subunit ClpA